MNAIADRKSRSALIAAINRYLDGETTAFKFDDEIFSIQSEDDPTITYVVHQLWLFYDDLKDHKVKLSKEAWDYFQRLVLVLKSDTQIEVQTRRLWDYSQLVALVALLLFVYVTVPYRAELYDARAAAYESLGKAREAQQDRKEADWRRGKSPN